MARLYETTNEFVCHRLIFQPMDATSIKSAREDFNDMFCAEYRKRTLHDDGQPLADADLSLVFILTYNDSHLHKMYGHNMLDSDDLRVYSKASKLYKMLKTVFGYEFDFVCVGEYGEGGKTHNYEGARGKGENPHFHCVGFFHHCGEIDVEKAINYMISVGMLEAENLDRKKVEVLFHSRSYLYNVLCNVIRFAWQGNFYDDIKMYARVPLSQRVGLGFVKLDGEIKTAAGGSTYISKYIGKDIKSLRRRTFLDGFVPSVQAVLSDYVRGCVPHILDYWLYYRKMFPKQELVNAGFKSFLRKVQPSKFVIYQNAYSHLFDVFEKLDELYLSCYAEFYSLINGRYSPKVRKFHGFGYSLLKDADINKGTYTAIRKGVPVTRCLPPSIARWTYYDHIVVDKDGEKIVKYMLNDLGRLKLKSVLKMQIEEDKVLAAGKIATELLAPASVFLHCLSTYDVKLGCYGRFDFDFLLTHVDQAIDYAVNCRQVYVYEKCIPLVSTCIDLADYWLKRQHFDVFQAYEKLKAIRQDCQLKRENHNAEYIDKWRKVLMFNY